MIPVEIKSSSTVEIYKNKIRKWWPADSDCDIHRTYISKIGYVNVVNYTPTLNQWEVDTRKFAGGIYTGD